MTTDEDAALRARIAELEAAQQHASAILEEPDKLARAILDAIDPGWFAWDPQQLRYVKSVIATHWKPLDAPPSPVPSS